ncbi:phospholipase-like protein [Artemisia annua]|uniref:Phospholipase-like protein n=1 Tax=Artemisia annua TaxID=35608 RepID=A0A2U1P2H3_ARTAN|nr:phospholipase-like protein [Artemisia annua]
MTSYFVAKRLVGFTGYSFAPIRSSVSSHRRCFTTDSTPGIFLLSMRSAGQKYRIQGLEDDTAALKEENSKLVDRVEFIKNSLSDEAAADKMGFSRNVYLQTILHANGSCRSQIRELIAFSFLFSELLNWIAKMASRFSSSSVSLEIKLTKVGEKLLHLPSSTEEIIPCFVRTEDILPRLPQSASISMIKPLHPVIKALIAEDLFFELTAFEKVSSSSGECYTKMIKVLKAFSNGLLSLFFLLFLSSSSTAVVSKMEKIMTMIIKEIKELPRELVNLLAMNGKSNKEVLYSSLITCCTEVLILLQIASPVCTQLAKKLLKTYADQLNPDIPDMV